MNGLSIRRAAKKWGIKSASPYDRLSGEVEIGRRCGPPPVLAGREESQCTDWLIELADPGIGVSEDHLFQVANAL